MPSGKKILLLAIVALQVFFLNAPAAFAKDLRFVTIDVAPWASLDPQSGKPVGVFPAVVAEIERRTGHHIAIFLQPFARIPYELEAAQKDCAILVWNDDWARFMVRGEVVSTHVFGVIARKGVKLGDYDDLHGLDISVLRGLSLGERFDNDPAIKRQIDTDYLMGLQKLAHRRLDAVAGALPTIRYLAKQKGLDGELGEQFTLSEVVLPFQCAKASPNLDVMPAINQAIVEMRNDGSIDKIKKDYDYF